MVSATKIRIVLAALGTLLLAPAGRAADRLVDSASFEIGGGSKVQMVRAGVQSDWAKRWFAGDGYHLSGYWDATLAHWRGNAYRNVPGQHQDITVVSFTPVFRYQRDDKQGLYAEAGIGAALFSEVYRNDDKRLSTAFEFGDHIGIGYVLNKRLDLGLKIQHYSNGGIKHPNSGVNWLIAKASYRF